MTAIGEVKLSNGQRLTAVEWRANRLADALAKQAALTRKAPVAVIQTLKSARAAVRHSAALLGQVTHAANNHRVVGWRPDGTAEVKVMRDSQPKDPSTRRVRQNTSDAAPVRAPADILHSVPSSSGVDIGPMRGGGDHRRYSAASEHAKRQRAKAEAQVQRRVEEIGRACTYQPNAQSATDRLDLVKQRVRARLRGYD